MADISNETVQVDDGAVVHTSESEVASETQTTTVISPEAQALLDIAKQQAAADAAWNQGIYGNVQAYFKGLSDIGRENAQHNMIADMAADGLFGTMSDKQYSGKGFLRKKKLLQKGGKINRKKK